MIRDRAEDDKLVKVEEPLDDVFLYYNWSDTDEGRGRLWYVDIIWPDYEGIEVKQIFKLYYGDYENSEDEIESLLMKVEQATTSGIKIKENVGVIYKGSSSSQNRYNEIKAEATLMKDEQSSYSITKDKYKQTRVTIDENTEYIA